MRTISILFILLISIHAGSNELGSVKSTTPDRRYLIDEYLIVATDECTRNNGNNTSVFVNFFDRNSYKELKSIQILGCDHEYQDYVSNIYKNNDEYFISISNRYDDKERTSLVIVDPNELRIKSRLTGEQLISRKIQLQPESEIQSFPFTYNGKNITYKTSDDSSYSSIFISDAEGGQSKLLFKAKMFNRVSPNLITQVGHLSNFIISNDNLVFGYNRDLYSINLQSYEVKIVPEYQSGGFQDNGHGRDKNRIDKILDDKGYNRILIFCFNGNCNSYIPYSYLKGMESAF